MAFNYFIEVHEIELVEAGPSTRKTPRNEIDLITPEYMGVRMRGILPRNSCYLLDNGEDLFQYMFALRAEELWNCKPEE